MHGYAIFVTLLLACVSKCNVCGFTYLPPLVQARVGKVSTASLLYDFLDNCVLCTYVCIPMQTTPRRVCAPQTQTCCATIDETNAILNQVLLGSNEIEELKRLRGTPECVDYVRQLVEQRPGVEVQQALYENLYPFALDGVARAYVHTYIHIYIYTYIHTHTYIHAHIHTHIYTHTHMQINNKTSMRMKSIDGTQTFRRRASRA
jgi:hypothetical protein